MSNPVLIRQVIALNERGVHALVSGGSPRSSVTMFKSALAGIGRLVSEGESSLVKSSEVVEANLLICSAVQIKMGLDLEDHGFYIFDQALVFQGQAVASPGLGLGPVEASYCSAVIVFNLALTYHQVARQTGDERKLRNACALYSKCIKISETVASESSDMHFLSLVASNNAAQIQYVLANYKECQTLVSRVQQRSVALNKTEGSSISFIREHQLTKIVLNMVVFATMVAPSA